MALTPSSVTRTDDPVGPSGDTFLTFDIPGGNKAQGMALVDSNGAPIGFTGSPIVTSITGTVPTSTTIVGTVPTTVSGTVTTTISGTPNVNIAGLSSPNPFPVTTSLATLTFFHSGAANVASYVIQNGAGNLKELRVVLDSSIASIRYLMLFRGVTALPSNGTVPAWVIMIPPLGEASESFPSGFAYTTGLVAGLSTTHNTLTVATAACVIFGQRV